MAGTLTEGLREQQAKLEEGGVGQTVLPSASSAGRLFAVQDRELDCATTGPLWLKDARVAGMVVEALHYGAVVRGMYEVVCVCRNAESCACGLAA